LKQCGRTPERSVPWGDDRLGKKAVKLEREPKNASTTLGWEKGQVGCKRRGKEEFRVGAGGGDNVKSRAEMKKRFSRRISSWNKAKIEGHTST